MRVRGRGGGPFGAFPAPGAGRAIEAFPFIVKGFHVDNGSEYVNHRVAALLSNLHVEELTKPRPIATTTTPWSNPRTPPW